MINIESDKPKKRRMSGLQKKSVNISASRDHMYKNSMSNDPLEVTDDQPNIQGCQPFFPRSWSEANLIMLLDAFLFFIYAPKMLFYNSIFSVLNYLFFGSY